MLDIGHDFKQIDPDWSDTLRVTKLPSFDESVRRGQQHVRRRAAEPPRRQVVDADRHRRPEDHLRVRAVRHRRRRRPDHLPPAPRLGRARARSAPARTGARSWIRTSSPTRSSTGDRRDGVLPQRPGPLDAAQGRHSNLMLALERPGASGDQGVYADRIELQNIKARFPLPGFLGGLQVRAGSWGYVRAAGILREIKWDDVLDDQFDLSGRRHRLGPEPQLESQSRQERRAPDAVRVRRRHPELHERLAGRHRHREQPLEPRHADPRQAASRSSASSPSSITRGTRSSRSAVGYSSQDNDNTDGQAPDAFQDRPVRARQRALLPRSRTS